VLPGSKVPSDGVVLWGTSHINESMITGESAPMLKEVSSVVIGGTINLHGILHVQATKVGSGTVLSQIISLVETAQMSKAPIQKFADYVSILLCLSYHMFAFSLYIKYFRQLGSFSYIIYVLSSVFEMMYIDTVFMPSFVI
jgi:Cu+-exporting ATPase